MNEVVLFGTGYGKMLRAAAGEEYEELSREEIYAVVDYIGKQGQKISDQAMMLDAAARGLGELQIENSLLKKRVDDE